MQNFETLRQKVFSIKTESDFEYCTLEVFKWQYKTNLVYRNFIEYLEINPNSIQHWTQIPFLPIEFFKTHQVKSFEKEAIHFFTSSGTTGIDTSRHYILDISVYEESFNKGFKLFWGNPKDYVIIALLPNYLEQQHSSLIYMISGLMQLSGDNKSKFYKEVSADLIKEIKELDENSNRKLIIFGVAYSLLDLIEMEKFRLSNTIVFETGGMKGRRKEMIKEELHTVLCEGFGIKEIASEYGMTELFSQAYSKGKGIFNTPPWMKICIRDVNDPMSFVEQNQTGGISVIDLANLYSCSFIATKDLGRQFSDGSFEILGRFDNSDIRGCNLLYYE